MIILCYIYYGFVGKVEEVVIPDNVEELCESCFCRRTSLSRVPFSESSSLKRIGKKAFRECGVREIHIPDDVEGPSLSCFWWCEDLSSVTFDQSPSLNVIGKKLFFVVREIRKPVF